VATTAALAIVIVGVGLASLKPKAEQESVNRLPWAVFSYDATNLTVTVNASDALDPDGSIANYSWKFGDGTDGTGAVVTHVYPANGTYTIELNLTDNRGGHNSTSDDVTVSTTVVLVKNDPVAVIKIVSMENGTVALEALGSYDPDGGDITSFAWDFGDGSSAEGSSVTHTYAANGTYSIALTVKDDENATDASAVEIVIVIESEEEEPPTPDPDEKVGPPGLLRAIDDHTERLDEQPNMQNSLDHLVENLDRWLEKHSP
jgi:PKD repeat protein